MILCWWLRVAPWIHTLRHSPLPRAGAEVGACGSCSLKAADEEKSSRYWECQPQRNLCVQRWQRTASSRTFYYILWASAYPSATQEGNDLLKAFNKSTDKDNGGRAYKHPITSDCFGLPAEVL